MGTFIFVHMAHELSKCIHRKLNVADFQCKDKGKYTLNVNIFITTKVSNRTTNIVIGGITGTVTVLAILFIIIYIKKKRARHIQPKPEASELQLIEKPKQPVYDETHLENDYDHLHEHQETHTISDVNVYDVSIPCADVTNIGADVKNTSKDFDCDKTYDHSTHSNRSNVDNSILNNDQYGTIPAGTYYRILFGGNVMFCIYLICNFSPNLLFDSLLRVLC